MIKAVQAVLGLGLLCFAASQAAVAAPDYAKLPRIKQELVAPPNAPKHDQTVSGGPRIVVGLRRHRQPRAVSTRPTLGKSPRLAPLHP